MTNSDFHRYMEMFLTPATPQPLTFHVTDSTMINLGPELPRNDNPIASPLFLRLGCNGERIRGVFIECILVIIDLTSVAPPRTGRTPNSTSSMDLVSKNKTEYWFYRFLKHKENALDIVMADVSLRERLHISTSEQDELNGKTLNVLI